MKITKHKLLLVPFFATFFLLFFRLVHLQLVQGSEFRQLADNNRFYVQTIPAERGVILDRYGQNLVRNKKIFFVDEDKTNYGEQLKPLADKDALHEFSQGSVDVSYQLRRYYLFPKPMSHALGYVSPASAEDLLAHSDLKANDWLGKMGLEQQFDPVLRGQDGKQVFEVNTLGEKQRLLSETKPESGQNIQTSLDPYLSVIAHEALGAMKGAAVILDAETGQVLSLVSKPGFDPNDFTLTYADAKLEQKRQQKIRSYFQDDRQVFFNRATNGVYPPGSVFKLVTAVAGLQQDAFDENKTVLDEGVLKVGDYSYANWLYTSRGATDGEISLVRAIARSNDIYFYKAAEWTGPEALAAQAREFGFGKKTGLEISAEATGFVPDPEWKEEVQGERWFLGNTYHFGIGQGDMLTTVLQNAQLVQTLINNGQQCSPRLVGLEEHKKIDKLYDYSCTSLGITEKNLSLVLSGMLEVCLPGGTASSMFAYNQDIADYNQANVMNLIQQGAVVGKTGTAEFGGEDSRGYRNTHGWFVAGTSVNSEQIINNLDEANIDPESVVLSESQRKQWKKGVQKHGFPEKIVIAVIVESDDNIPHKEGSIHAAPVVKSILDWLK